ncbi:hypothetical protein KDL01_01265 [Actinospica durhamensis]|uniref:Tetratricopeptide repeat protein n=1 Tax=Actinospica durhamensis TaxID=1508375 RepID=A0A941IPE3_9ACTN|nr:hypothetical protein [Actinospica durhamensis]MBR7831868.1 hypothetical protein [Actinospica durhamensis]
MATDHPADVAGELEITGRLAAAGEFEHAVDHVIRALTAGGATPEIKDALEMLAARVAEAGSQDAGLTGTLAGLFIDTGDTAQAVSWAQRTYELAPQERRSRAQLLAFTYKHTGDIELLVQLADLAREEPDEDDVVRRLFAVSCRGTTWLGFVPGPTDSLVSLTHNLLASGDYTPGPDGTYDAPLVLKASALESPSAAAAFGALFPEAQLTVVEVPEPDIRRPAVEGLAYRLWDYQDTTAIARYPEPSPQAAATLRRVAATRWGDPLHVFEQSAALGELGDEDLLGLLTHVPPAPDDERWAAMSRHNPLYWPRVAQVWVCLGWLHVRPEEPWRTSTRLHVLGDLLFGPEDWTVDAAANALATAAWNLPETRAEILNLLMKRTLTVIEASHSRATELLEPLGELILTTPGDNPRLREPIRDILAMHRSLAEPPVPAEFTPDAIKQWGQGIKAQHDAQAAARNPDKKRRLWKRSS